MKMPATARRVGYAPRAKDQCFLTAPLTQKLDARHRILTIEHAQQLIYRRIFFIQQPRIREEDLREHREKLRRILGGVGIDLRCLTARNAVLEILECLLQRSLPA